MTPPSSGLALDFTLIKSARVPAGLLSADDLKALARFVLEKEGVESPVVLTVDLTNAKRIQQLNRHFRGVDRTTDVIAFRDDLPAQEAPNRLRVESKRYWRPTLPARGRLLQGDVAINIEQASQQAREVGHPASREIRLLLIHGLLHLLGYTDYDPRPRRRMFKRQDRWLRQWESRKRV